MVHLANSVSEAIESVEVLTAHDPERVRSRIVNDCIEDFAVGMKEALQMGSTCYACGRRKQQPWAYRLFAKLAKLVDREVQVAIAVWAQIGVRDEFEAKSLIAAAKSASDLDDDSLWLKLTGPNGFVVDYVRRNPEAGQKLAGQIVSLEPNRNGTE